MTHFQLLNRMFVCLLGTAWCCLPCVAYADPLCRDLDARTARFVETIQQHAPKTASGGQFQVIPLDAGGGRKKFDVIYKTDGKERFRLSVEPHTQRDEEFMVSPIRTRHGGALLVTVGFGGSNGVGCGYLIHANTNRFRFERIEGVFNAADVNRDGLDEIVVYERQDLVDRCDTKTSWRRIYRLDASGGTLVDASKDFASYYGDVEKDYRNEKSQYERTPERSKKECQQQYKAIIRRANALAGSGVSPVAAESKLSATLAIGDRNPTAPVPGSLFVAPWRALELGKSGNGVAFRRVGNDAIAFFDKTEIAKCVKGSEFQGERKTFLAGTLAVSRVHVSPVSPTGAYIAVFCGDEDSASGVQLLMPQTKSFFSPLPRDLFLVLQPWISFSPDDRYAILNQSGDEGNYSPLVLNLITRQAKKLGAPLFAHDEKTQPVWLNDKIVKYRVGQICDDKRDASCKSMGIYEFEVDVSSMKVKRKRISDYRP